MDISMSPAPPVRKKRHRLSEWLAWLIAGPQEQRLNKSRHRVALAMVCFVLVYGTIAAQMVRHVAFPDKDAKTPKVLAERYSFTRPDIVDRNGQVLATDVRRPSLFAEPSKIIDVDEATELLTATLPDLDYREVRDRLGSKKDFAWLKREITKDQQREIHRLGIPGIGFREEAKRVYPNGPVLSHVMGHVNIDNQGIAGIEKYLDTSGMTATRLPGDPVVLSIDLRVQHALRDELLKARELYKAKAAAGVIVDVDTGEIVSMVSVPDYDPNRPGNSMDEGKINRLTTGVFEMGSTFKAMTIAMALDSGKFTLNSSVDARFPLQIGKYAIKDFHGQRRVLSLPEVFTYSSNIGTSRMALSLGADHHKSFLKRMGQLDRLTTELPESARPLYPQQARWADISTATISFGHGLSVAPLQAVMAVTALVNGGYLVKPTFMKRDVNEVRQNAPRVVKPETSEQMRFLMRLNAEVGSGKSANVDGYYVGGKTGTSEKVIGGRYSKNKNLNSFMAVFPADKPRYVSLVMLDEPQGIKETHFLSTSGWNAAPTTGKVIARAAPLLGLSPRFDVPVSAVSFPVNYRGHQR